jgi:CheY-like chemotaxis protein
MMGGSIRAANRPAGGAVFEIVLPLGDDCQPQAPTTTCPVKLVGLPSIEAQAFASELHAWHAEVRTIDSFGHLSRWDLTGPEAEIIVLPAEALSDAVTRHHVDAALAAGRCIAVVTTIGQPWAAAAEYAGRVIPLDRPLRARHLFDRCLPVAAAAQKPSAAGRLAGVHILAAEDNRMNQMVLQQLLEHEGCAVTLAISGAHALSTLQDQGCSEFDLVLADIQMPGMDGYELSRRIAGIDPTLPVLALTASTLPEDRYRSFEAGMREHIVKPVDLDTLVACIHRHSRHRLSGLPGAHTVLHQ